MRVFAFLVGVFELSVLVASAWTNDYSQVMLPDGRWTLVVWSVGAAFFFFVSGYLTGEKR